MADKGKISLTLLVFGDWIYPGVSSHNSTKYWSSKDF